MLHRVRALVTVLALGLPAAGHADPVSTFLRQDRYTYCDVKMLSALWKQSIGDAKATVGLKIENRAEAYLQAELRSARANAQQRPAARCSFHDAGFTYDDATRLARVWGNTAGEAKALVEQKILGGAERYVRSLLAKQAPAPQPPDPVSTFLAQDAYTYCDVKLLSALWKTSASDAKATIGLKLQHNAASYLDRELASARRRTRVSCHYSEVGFSYDDMERLGKLWKVSTSQAKATANRKIRGGGTSFLREQLGGPGSERDREIATFLAQDKYTYCDAKMIAGMWKQSIEESKAFIGAKLGMRSTRSVDRTVSKARVHAQKNQAARCSFHDAGFTYQDAVRLARMWRVSEGDAKALVEDKIVAGQEAAIRQQLRARPRPYRKAPPPPRRP